MKKDNPKVYQEMEERKKGMEFIATGLDRFDQLLDGGFLRKEMVVIGGVSGSGKSYIAGEMFYSSARQGFRSAYFSLEISSQMVQSRILGSLSDIKPINILTGRVSELEWEKQENARRSVWVHNADMWYYDDVYRLEEMDQEIKAHRYEFVVIDFIQNMIANERDEYARLSSLAIAIQRMAKVHDCCILVVSQLSNDKANKIYHEDEVLSYKGSGSIATACDLGLVVLREKDEQGFIQDRFRIVVRKNRRGISNKFVSYSFLQPGGKILESAT